MNKKKLLDNIAILLDEKFEEHFNLIDKRLKYIEKKIEDIEEFLYNKEDTDDDTESYTDSDDTSESSSEDSSIKEKDIHKIKIDSENTDDINNITFEQIIKKLLIKMVKNS